MADAGLIGPVLQTYGDLKTASQPAGSPGWQTNTANKLLTAEARNPNNEENWMPTQPDVLSPFPEPQTLAWSGSLQDGSQSYFNVKFGRANDPHNVEIAKERATEIKKLLRNQCIYDGTAPLYTGATNTDYLKSRQDLIAGSDNTGYTLANLYKNKMVDLVNYYGETKADKPIISPGRDDGEWYDGHNLMPFDISQETNNTNNWEYSFNNLYYPIPGEINRDDGGPLDVSRGTLARSDAVSCIPISGVTSRTPACSTLIPQGMTDLELEKGMVKCKYLRNDCELKVNLKDQNILNLEQTTERKNSLLPIQPDSANIKTIEDLGSGLFGRWDSTEKLCGPETIKCHGKVEENYLSDVASGVPSTGENCSFYFQKAYNESKIGDKDIVDADAAGTPKSSATFSESDKKILCEKKAIPNQTSSYTWTSDFGSATTGCHYRGAPDYYKDMNLVDKCSVDDLYDKLEKSGMRRVDLDKIEFTNNCPKRDIGFDVDFACTDKTGSFLSKTQGSVNPDEFFENVYECTGEVINSDSAGDIDYISATPGGRKTDCVDPLFRKAWLDAGEMKNADGKARGKPTKNKGESVWTFGDGREELFLSLPQSATTHYTEVRLGRNSMGEDMPETILKNDCYWQPILKDKEYVDEDSVCNIRCKSGAIQKGGQPYCKSSPDYDTDGKYNIGYLNPYLNPEWELNNFSCTAIEEYGCPIGGTPAAEDENIFSTTRVWDSSKNTYVTKIQSCRNRQRVDVETADNQREALSWGVFLCAIIMMFNLIWFVFNLFRPGSWRSWRYGPFLIMILTALLTLFFARLKTDRTPNAQLWDDRRVLNDSGPWMQGAVGIAWGGVSLSLSLGVRIGGKYWIAFVVMLVIAVALTVGGVVWGDWDWRTFIREPIPMTDIQDLMSKWANLSDHDTNIDWLRGVDMVPDRIQWDKMGWRDWILKPIRADGGNVKGTVIAGVGIIAAWWLHMIIKSGTCDFWSAMRTQRDSHQVEIARHPDWEKTWTRISWWVYGLFILIYIMQSWISFDEQRWFSGDGGDIETGFEELLYKFKYGQSNLLCVVIAYFIVRGIVGSFLEVGGMKWWKNMAMSVGFYDGLLREMVDVRAAAGLAAIPPTGLRNRGVEWEKTVQIGLSLGGIVLGVISWFPMSWVIPGWGGADSDPRTPSKQFAPKIKPSSCYKYSDCILHDNCIWDEIKMIIDGPSDYVNPNIYDDSPQREMIELMYGFLYLLYKYKDKIEAIEPSPIAKFTTPYMRDAADIGPRSMTGAIDFADPNDIQRDDLDINSDLYKWIHGNAEGEWNHNAPSVDSFSIIKDANGNKTTIKQLANTSGTSITVLQEVFFYMWNIFHNGSTGQLRIDITDQLGRADDAPNKYKIPTGASGVGDLHNKMLNLTSDQNQDPTRFQPDSEQIRKSIPIFKLIFKEWLNDNIEVYPNTADGLQCSVPNPTCTFGYDKIKGECRGGCDNDEILDYSNGLCQLDNISNPDFKNIMKHSYNQPDPKTNRSFREFGPNFQRFYCEGKYSSGPGPQMNEDYHYQKAGCILNDFLNNNAVKGERCIDYENRAEASGFNIDCNSEHARVHFSSLSKAASLPTDTKDCYTQMTNNPSSLVIDKICGGTNEQDKSSGEYVWNGDKYIDTGINETSVNHPFFSYGGGNLFSDISPILSCCEYSPSPGTDNRCSEGSWVEIIGGDGKGYCSSDPPLNGGSVQPRAAAESLEMDPDDLCSYLSIDATECL